MTSSSQSAGETLYIVMPAYNEADNIEDTVSAWYRLLRGKSDDSRLVIADTGSTDNTHKILRSLQKKYPKLKILATSDKQHGPKLIALYNYSVDHGADYVFQTDSDGQTNPDEFATFWKLRHKYDLILGHRKLRGDGKSRALVEKVVCSLLWLFFGVKVPDANAPFRLMKAKTLRKYLPQLPSLYALPNIILTAFFANFEANTLTFREVSFQPRQKGTNSINLKKIFKIGTKSLFDFLGFRKKLQLFDPQHVNKTIERQKNIFALVVFSVLSFVIISTSPSHPWNNGETVTDSGVFLTIARQIRAGQAPYRDTFDHKGPLLYLLNLAGLFINENWGIVVIEFFTLVVAFYFIYKIARLASRSSKLCIFVSLIAAAIYLELNRVDRGNLTEEYSLPFVSASLYIYLDYLLNGKTTIFRVVMSGLCFACVLMLRVNMITIWAIFCLAIAIKLLIRKEYKNLIRFTLAFLAGAVIVFLPIFGWLLRIGALEEFYQVYISFNLSYAKAPRSLIASTMLYFLKQPVFLTATLISLFFVHFYPKKHFSAFFSLLFLLAFIAASMSGRNYPHYGMVLIPLFSFPLSFTLASFMLNSSMASRLPFSNLLLIICLFVSPTWSTGLGSFLESFNHRRIGEPIADSATVPSDLIQQYTEPSDRISVFGNRNYIYLRSNRLPATRYSYQFPIAETRPEILAEYFTQLAEIQPKLIVVQAGYVRDDILAFLEKNHYSQIWNESASGVTSSDSEQSTRVYLHESVPRKTEL